MISSSGGSLHLWYLSTAETSFVTDRPIETLAISDDGTVQSLNNFVADTQDVP